MTTAQDSYSLVDKLVLIDEEIKRLEKRRDELKQAVIAMEEGGHPGHEGAVTVTLQSRKNFKSDKAKAFMTEEQFNSCYETDSSIVCRITRFNREEVEA
jgi:hypothetical protein